MIDLNRNVRPQPMTIWLEASRQRGKRLRAMRRCTAVIGLAVAALSWTVVTPPAPRLLWNASASAPIGLYRVEPQTMPERGDWVIAWPPIGARSLAASRRYLPTGVPLVKRVAAGIGDTVCATGSAIRINGAKVALRRNVDGNGRQLPLWQGCVRLGQGALFLLTSERPDSFDGRYFGVSKRADVIGKAVLLWAR